MGLIFVGLLSAAIGGFGLFWVGRREFNRRNAAGVEEFKGYGTAITTKLFEKAVRGVSVFFLLGGAAALFLGFVQSN